MSKTVRFSERFKNEVGKAIREKRNLMGYTTVRLGRATGYSGSHISSMENGTLPSSEALIKIMRELGMDGIEDAVQLVSEEKGNPSAPYIPKKDAEVLCLTKITRDHRGNLSLFEVTKELTTEAEKALGAALMNL